VSVGDGREKEGQDPPPILWRRTAPVHWHRSVVQYCNILALDVVDVELKLTSELPACRCRRLANVLELVTLRVACPTTDRTGALMINAAARRGTRQSMGR